MLVKHRTEPSAWKERSTVRIFLDEEELERLKIFWSQAITRPPKAPATSTDTRERREAGRKWATFAGAIGLSLDSWRATKLARAAKRSAETESHLSSSPRPQTFQDATRKTRLFMGNTVDTR
jgi:hypothetical protein